MYESMKDLKKAIKNGEEKQENLTYRFDNGDVLIERKDDKQIAFFRSEYHFIKEMISTFLKIEEK